MLQTQIKEEMVGAMKAKDTVRVSTLRNLSAAFTNELVASNRKPTDMLSDEEAQAVIRREVKKRKEAREAFEKAGRAESAAQEHAEQTILESYLPRMMDEADVARIVATKQDELAITEKKDMGRLIGAVMAAVKGTADGETVKRLVEDALS
jgi:uncharacterized protein